MTRDIGRVLPDLSEPDYGSFELGRARKGYVPNSLKALALGLPSLRLKIAKNRKRLRQAEKAGDTLTIVKLKDIILKQETKALLTAQQLAAANVNIPVFQGESLEAPKADMRKYSKPRREFKPKGFKTWSSK